jgi:hypothetical protein
MTHKRSTPLFCFIVASLLSFVSGCDKSSDTQNQDVDLSQITVTGKEGPADFLGNIDVTDWDPSSYRTIFFGKSFWIQKSSLSDTLLFAGRSAGDTISQSLKIYNSGSTNLSIRLELQSPFFAGYDSIEIHSSSLEMARIYFILPDSTNTVHNGTLALRCSTQDSVFLELHGYHVQAGSHDSVVVSLPNYFSFAPAYPNPTDGEIRFTFTVPQRTDGVLQVVNKKNELVATIAQGNYVAGVHIVDWNANVANGNYRVVFQSGNYTSHGDIHISK